MCWNWTTTNNIWPSQCCLSQQSEWCKLDVSGNRVWGGRFQKTFFDVRVFNPLTPSNRNQALTAAYRKHEPETKRAYQQCIQVVEHSSFTSLIFSPTGGMDNEATTFYKCLALLFAQKWDSSHSMTLCWLRCHLNYSSFALLSKQIEVPDPLSDMQPDHIQPSTLSLPITYPWEWSLTYYTLPYQYLIFLPILYFTYHYL